MTTLTTILAKVLAAAILAAGLSGGALAQGAHHHGGEAHGAPGDSPSTAAYKKADAAMMRDMAAPYTGDPDVDFRTHMIAHHKGAVGMAKVALDHAKDPETKAMARQIIDDQEKEITQMEAWLKRNAEPSAAKP